MANRLPFLIAAVCTVLSFILCVVGFGTGFWWVTIDDTNTFSNAGLWEICFNGYEHTSDLIGKAYYSCWWIFYREYYYIRDWLLPPWFIACQTLMTFAVVFQFAVLVLFPLSTSELSESQSVRTLTLTCIVTGLITACISTSVVIFGVMIGLDRTWMPNWHMNVLGWSYGLVVVSGFLSTFSFIAITTFTLMRKYEILRDNYKPVSEAPKQAQMLPKV